MGGLLIFCYCEGDLNFLVIFEIFIQYGSQQIMVQCYLLEIKDGDKCILMIDGELVFYCLVCIFVQGEICGNFVVGGCGVVQLLSECDCWIVVEVGLYLCECGLLFVGFDVIGDYLMEINVISLICICEIDQVFDICIGDKLMDVIVVQLVVC